LQLFDIYRETKQTAKAEKLALDIVNKNVKIQSNTIRRKNQLQGSIWMHDKARLVTLNIRKPGFVVNLKFITFIQILTV
jgi:hypothetical protein